MMSRASAVLSLVLAWVVVCSGAERIFIGKSLELVWEDHASPSRADLSTDPYRHPELVLQARSTDRSQNLPRTFIWRTYKEYPFLVLGNASLPRAPILDGNYQLQQSVAYLSDRTTVDEILPSDESIGCIISGRLLKNSALIANYELKFSESSEGKMAFTVDVVPNPELFDTPHGSSLKNPRTFLTYACDADENFYGFGESFSFFNLKGRNVPILVSEQGVGRGEQPITDTLNTDVAQGVGGTWYTTYAPKPIYVTNYNRTVMLSNSEVSFFNLTNSIAEEPHPRVQIELWSLHMKGRIIQSSSMLQSIEAITEVTGRQQGLPEWTQLGAVVGLEGGTANVTAIVDRMRAAGVPMAGIWLQDWVGLQHSWDGDRLIWNWELNMDHYPGWAEMTAKWAADGTRVLTYMSPFFSDPTAYLNSTTAFRHNFFQEGITNGYFVQNANGSTYLMYSLSIKFAMLDLTNPEAVAWMKNIIIQQSVEEAGSSGWMCDFGEYLPFDAVLYSGESAASFHNRYPEEWGKLTRDALDEAAARRHVEINGQRTKSSAAIDPSDVMFFMRSAWIQSPRYAPVFWLGDQLVSWDSNDGLRSALTGALSSGLVGHSVTHSDIGGYTVETDLGPNMYYVRTPELLQRWSEMGAFGFGLFRTHIGSSTTPLDAQVYDTPESMAHFARFASIYAQQAGYRKVLLKEAEDLGHPLIRHMCLHYGYDDQVWDLTEQYLVGTQMLVAPVLYEGATSVNVYFPKLSGSWVHIWSGKVVTSDSSLQGVTVTVPAAIGFPPVFYQQGSVAGEELRAFLVSQGYAEGYHWDNSDELGSEMSETAEDAQAGEPSTINANKINYIVPLAVVLVILLGLVTIHVVQTLRNAKGDVQVGDSDRLGLLSGHANERLLATQHEEL